MLNCTFPLPPSHIPFCFHFLLYVSSFLSLFLYSDRQHLGYDGCLETKGGYYQNCTVLCCVRQLCKAVSTQILVVLKLVVFKFIFR